MSKYRLTKTFRFEASHQLIGHDGRCSRLHGHSWIGKIVVEGPALHQSGPKKGMLVDYGDIKVAVQSLVDDYLDHHHLNETLEMDSPTSELIAKWIYDQLYDKIPGLAMIVVEETCTSSCQYIGG